MKQFYQGKQILITGGCGFIGSNLAIRLVELGAKVTISDSMIPEYGGNLFNIEPVRDKVTLSFTDMRDAYAMRYLVRQKEIIFNLAGQVSHIDSMNNPFKDLEINAVSQLQLLELCRYHNPSTRIVFSSTRQIYGKPQYLPVDEDHPLSPTDVNGINKLAGEQYHRLYCNVYGLPTVILRLTNTYGPRQLIKHNKQGFTGIFIRQAIEGDAIQLYGTGEQKRDFNYIDDVVEALLIAGKQDNLLGKTFNLGSNESYSLKQFVLILKDCCDFDFQLVPFPEDKQKIDIGDYYSDFNRFEKATGWKPQISLDEGLKKTIEFYKKNLMNYKE